MAPHAMEKAKSEMTAQLFVLCAVICITCISFGYDSTWWTGALGQTSLNVLYGDKFMISPILGPYFVLSATQTAVSVAVSYVFQVVGQFIASFVLNAKGRKAGLLVYAVITIVGTVVEITGTIGSGRFWHIVAGKFVVSIALGVGLGTAPLYLAECAPPSLRGALVNTCTVMVTLGSLLAAIANYGVSTMPPLSQTGLRILIGVQLAPPVLMFATLRLISESPRWLCQVGRLEDARKSITKLRSGTDDADINVELEKIQAAIEMDRMNKAQTGWAQLFRGSDLRRTLTVVGVMSIAQANGLAFLGNYAVVYLSAVGIKNVYVILMILYAVICASTVAGFWTQDHLGRRTVLLSTGCVLSAALICLGAVTTVYPAPVGAPAYAVVFLVFLFSVSYATGWGNTPYTLTSEVPSDTLRPRTWAVAGSSAALTGMIVGLVNPYLQDKDHGNLGGRVAFIYGAFGVVGIIFVYFFVPELKNKPIYDINWLYVNRIPPRQMKHYIVPQEQSAQNVDVDGKGSEIQLEQMLV